MDIDFTVPPLPPFVGVSLSVIRDIYGEWYIGIGGGVGVGEGGGIGGNIACGQVWTQETPSPESLKSYLSGLALNIALGKWVGIGFTTNFKELSVEPGVYTPQIGASVSFSKTIEGWISTFRRWGRGDKQ